MLILYGGIIFIHEDVSTNVRILLFAIIAVENFWFYLLWIRAMAESFQHRRLVAVAVKILRRISCYKDNTSDVNEVIKC